MATGCLVEGGKIDYYRRKRKVVIPREGCSCPPFSSTRNKVFKGKIQIKSWLWSCLGSEYIFIDPWRVSATPSFVPLNHTPPKQKIIILLHHSHFIYVNLFIELCKNSHNHLAGWETNVDWVPHPSFGVCSLGWVWAPWFMLLCFSWQPSSPGFTQMLNFGSQQHGGKLQTQRFCYKKQHSGIAAPVLGSQEEALRVCSPLPVKDAGFEGYPFLQC